MAEESVAYSEFSFTLSDCRKLMNVVAANNNRMKLKLKNIRWDMRMNQGVTAGKIPQLSF
jgi:hypothetical protein